VKKKKKKEGARSESGARRLDTVAALRKKGKKEEKPFQSRFCRVAKKEKKKKKKEGEGCGSCRGNRFSRLSDRHALRRREKKSPKNTRYLSLGTPQAEGGKKKEGKARRRGRACASPFSCTRCEGRGGKKR